MIRKLFIAWCGLMFLAVLNGGFRDFVYKPYIGELAGHQVSTAILLLLIAVFIRFLAESWPIKSARQAWLVGIMWFLMTEAFEFGMGRVIEGASWSTLFQAYNIVTGRVWIVIPVWVLIGPYVFYRRIRPKSIAPDHAETTAGSF